MFILIPFFLQFSFAITENRNLPDLKNNEFAFFENDKYIKFTFIEYENLKLSNLCFKRNRAPLCLAYSSSIKGPIKNIPYRGNPASQYCNEIGGINLIAFDSKKNEINICYFDDRSFVNSWSLYYKAFPKQ